MKHLEVLETKFQALSYHNDLVKLSLSYQNSHQMLILFRPQKCMFSFSPSDVLQLKEEIPLPFPLYSLTFSPSFSFFSLSSSPFSKCSRKTT